MTTQALNQRGFTLLEVIVAIVIVAVLAAALSPLVVQQARRQRSAATIEKMESVLESMIGQPGSGRFGYVGDMGILPVNLTDLIIPGPAYSPTIAGLSRGWNGPYVNYLGPPAELANDAWGTPFVYDPVAGAMLRSLGSDRQLGTADDITLPNVPADTTGDVVVTVYGTFPAGGQEWVRTLDDTDILTVAITKEYDPAPPFFVNLTWNTLNAFEIQDVHIGTHAVLTQALPASPYSACGIVTVIQDIYAGTNAVSVMMDCP